MEEEVEKVEDECWWWWCCGSCGGGLCEEGMQGEGADW